MLSFVVGGVGGGGPYARRVASLIRCVRLFSQKSIYLSFYLYLGRVLVAGAEEAGGVMGDYSDTIAKG